MNIPNTIAVQVKDVVSESTSYMGRIMRSRKHHREYQYATEDNTGCIRMYCRKESKQAYEFAVVSTEETCRSLIFSFCGMLLQCPEVTSVKVGYRENARAI